MMRERLIEVIGAICIIVFAFLALAVGIFFDVNYQIFLLSLAIGMVGLVMLELYLRIQWNIDSQFKQRYRSSIINEELKEKMEEFFIEMIDFNELLLHHLQEFKKILDKRIVEKTDQERFVEESLEIFEERIQKMKDNYEKLLTKQIELENIIKDLLKSQNELRRLIQERKKKTSK